MALEASFNTIDDLNPLNPTDTDLASQGDNHIRGIKAAIRGSFPSIGSTPVTVTAEQMNFLSAANLELADLEKLAAMDVTAARLNWLQSAGDLVLNDFTKLADINASAAEINHLQGVTSQVLDEDYLTANPLNAATLGGQTASYYLDAANLTGTILSGNLNLATEAQAQNGTANGVVMTPIRATDHFDARFDEKIYRSSFSPFTNSDQMVFNHGFNAYPDLTQVVLICTTPDGDYASGDRIYVPANSHTDGQNEGLSVRCTTSQVIVQIGENGPGIVTRKGSGGTVLLTSSSWTLGVRAMRF